MRPLPTWPVAAGSLVLGFAVAQATGARPLGGLVLAGAAAWCALRWRASRGAGGAAALLLLYLAAFAGAHVLDDLVGAWPAVFSAAALTGASAWALADRGVPTG